MPATSGTSAFGLVPSLASQEEETTMPNWCENELTVDGPETDVARFKEKAIGKSPWGDAEESFFNFHSLVPIPAEVIADGYCGSGYFWELDNWGCKWGASDAELTKEREGN